MKLYSHITSIVQISHIYLANEKYKDIPNCSVVKTLPSCTGVWVWSLLAWCEELIHLKRPWCWERLKAGGEGDDRGWDGWMASPTQWTWVWVNSRSWWWTGRPSVLRFMGSQRVRHDWATELKWAELNRIFLITVIYRLMSHPFQFSADLPSGSLLLLPTLQA